MLGVLLVTHGQLGEALVETAAMLIGATEWVQVISFTPGQGVEDLEMAVDAALAELGSCSGILGLVDLAGGSPARALAGRALRDPQLEVLAGVNLPMLAEILLSRQRLGLAELAQVALQCGTAGISDVGTAARQMTNEGSGAGIA